MSGVGAYVFYPDVKRTQVSSYRTDNSLFLI
jgi:hypothetical protein